MKVAKVACVIVTRMNDASRDAMRVRAVCAMGMQLQRDCVPVVVDGSGDELTIGELRNRGAEQAIARGADYICHWDDDDVSQPSRVLDQLGVLEMNPLADVTGYNSMLFARDTPGGVEAWYYRNPDQRYCIGTSLFYRVAAWKRRPFAALPVRGTAGPTEDNEWLSAQPNRLAVPGVVDLGQGRFTAPRIIARSHGGNTCDYSVIYSSPNWSREPLADDLVMEAL